VGRVLAKPDLNSRDAARTFKVAFFPKKQISDGGDIVPFDAVVMSVIAGCPREIPRDIYADS
jgi:hypothetical protein